ncbi:MAG: hypothetical protein EXQ96_01850 [Alphaproteobacteria bacterium]|nr:hypothetical protein [Alphaproteobacteria bacterium]
MTMWVRIENIGEGQHPSERIVVVVAADGSREQLIVDLRTLQNDMMEIGYPVGVSGDKLLVELPQETMQGAWRVWVRKDAVIDKAA